jgi:hypothetical protein
MREFARFSSLRSRDKTGCCTNADMFKGTNADVFKGTNADLFKGTNADTVFKRTNAEIL